MVSNALLDPEIRVTLLGPAPSSKKSMMANFCGILVNVAAWSAQFCSKANVLSMKQWSGTRAESPVGL